VGWRGRLASQDLSRRSPDAESRRLSRRGPKEEILEILTVKGIAARYEPRAPGLFVVVFDDPDGNFVELFPDAETMELPPGASCTAQELDRVMAGSAALVRKLA
jgi:hypothetical protein